MSGDKRIVQLVQLPLPDAYVTVELWLRGKDGAAETLTPSDTPYNGDSNDEQGQGDTTRNERGAE